MTNVYENLHVAVCILRLAADYPATFGRLRAARIVSGYGHEMFPAGDPRREVDDRLYICPGFEGSLRTTVAVIDGMIDSGFLIQSIGQRPRLCLTRRGTALMLQIDPCEETPTHYANAADELICAKCGAREWNVLEGRYGDARAYDDFDTNESEAACAACGDDVFPRDAAEARAERGAAGGVR